MSEKLSYRALLSGRKSNLPHPHESGKRIVGFVVDEDIAGLSDGLFMLDDLAARAEARPAVDREAVRCAQVEQRLSDLARAVRRVMDARDAFRSPDRGSHPNLVLEEAEAWIALRSVMSGNALSPATSPGVAGAAAP